MNFIVSVWKEFREFALRSSFVEVAIGIFVGAGLTPVAAALIHDVAMPLLSFLLGEADFVDMFIVLREGQPGSPYITLEAAKKAGAITVNYGNFLNKVVSFFMIAWVAFWVVKAVNRSKRKTESNARTEEASTKVCQYCITVVPVKASRCPACTSELLEEIS